jgi:hypothetical protein
MRQEKDNKNDSLTRNQQASMQVSEMSPTSTTHERLQIMTIQGKVMIDKSSPQAGASLDTSVKDIGDDAGDSQN